MRRIPFFSVPEINTIDDYTRFRACKAYLKQKSQKVATTRELAEILGYTKLDTFSRHRARFDALSRRIPREYLEAIDVKLDILEFCAELDREEYEKVLALPDLHPVCAVIRFIPAVYGTKTFAPGTSESDAIEQMVEYSKATGFSSCITFPQLKTVWIDTGGNAVTLYYPPDLRILDRWVVPHKDGSGIGTSYVR
ncbi:MAG: hypothetical protein EA426_17865 [Spirochaetaceae bacterium]|nr:MAG: hypothetical protein EA426_17865 [Spirochaetaceae bacterium]